MHNDGPKVIWGKGSLVQSFTDNHHQKLPMPQSVHSL